MIKFVDNIINSLTMYRLILYGLIVIVVYAVVCGFLGGVAYGGVELLESVVLLLVACYGANWLFSKLFNAPANVESRAITALILFCLFMPAGNVADAATLILASVIAMGSKYILALKREHVFNPAAFAAVVLSFSSHTVALWWVGTPVMLPVVALVGLAVVRKIRKFGLLLSFVAASIVGTFVFGLMSKTLSVDLFTGMLFSGPLLFLGTIMLTEPMTMPPRRGSQLIYGGAVGLLQTAQFNFGPLYSTPELALVVGNIFSYIVSPRQKFIFGFLERRKIARNIYEFVFRKEGGLKSDVSFEPGQYMEWMLPHARSDSRGVRRFFSIASSPREEEIRIGVRIADEGSSFKKKLFSLEKGDRIIAAQLAGDFVLPEERGRKLVFIAGGIGVTPFRSMIKYLMDLGERRDIVLLYFNKTEEEIAYRDIFDKAREEIGLKMVYVLTDREHISGGWNGELGRLDEVMLHRVVPDFGERIFYISGPNALVNSYKRLLIAAGVSRSSIKTDYFSGY